MGYFSQALIDETGDREIDELDEFKSKMVMVILEAFPEVRCVDLMHMSDKQLRKFYGKAKFFLNKSRTSKKYDSYQIIDEESLSR